jgi:predicted nucleic acid-binding protein
VALSRYCLDTSAYSWFRRGDPAIVELVDAAQWVGMPAVVLGELHAGFRAGARRRRNETELEEFLAHPIVETVPVDHEVGRVYADIVHALRAKGTPIPTNDVWVAASTGRVGATLVAYDEHFALVDRIGAILLRPGVTDARG